MIPQHIAFEKLVDLAEGRMASAERASSTTHVSTCSVCSSRLAQLEQVLRLMRTDAAEEAPRDLVAGAIGLFASRAIPPPPSLVRRLIAALSFDSLQTAAASGVRSGPSGPRQLLYNTGENDLDLRLTPKGEAWIISGQVLGECMGGRVELEGTAGARTELNALCEFTLPPVPAGSYRLRFHLGHTEIEVSELMLQS